jgi:hypothetical protein
MVIEKRSRGSGTARMAALWVNVLTTLLSPETWAEFNKSAYQTANSVSVARGSKNRPFYWRRLHPAGYFVPYFAVQPDSG